MKIIDLTLEYNSDILGPSKVYHNNPVKVELVAVRDADEEKYFRDNGFLIADNCVQGWIGIVSRVTLTAHVGTHVDTPFHFYKDASKSESLDLEVLINKAIVLDFSHKKGGEHVNAEELEKLANGKINQNVIPIIRCDWVEKKFGQPDFYTHQPGFMPDVADWVLSKGVRAICTDFLPDLNARQPGADQSQRGACHFKLLREGVSLIENVTNLSNISEEEVMLFALPLKIKGMEAAPARVIAIEGLKIL